MKNRTINISQFLSFSKKIAFSFLFYLALIASTCLPVMAEQIEQLITNGSFTSDFSGWIKQGDDSWAGNNLTNYRTSPGYAALGVWNDGWAKDNADGAFYQTVTIPANATTATFSFWYYISTQEETVNSKYDNLYVTVRDSSGGFLEEVVTLSNLDETTGYVKYTFDMSSSYIGETIRIRFGATTDSTNTTTFRIDDVEIVSVSATQYSLSINVSPIGSGSVSGEGSYDPDTSVTLTATPNSGYEFENWSGDVISTINQLIITMDGDKDIIANFTQVGSIRVSIVPEEVVSAGAQWRVADESSWRNSGTIKSDVQFATYTIEFKDIVGWITPPNKEVTVFAAVPDPWINSDPYVSEDVIAPENSTISINSGANYTFSTSAILSIAATDNIGVTGYYVSESDITPSADAEGWVVASSSTAYNADISFSLSSGDGTKTVYAWFKDKVGNVSSMTSDSIIIDTTSSVIIGLSDDITAVQTKTWAWNADETATFRYAIDQNAEWTSTGNFADITTATKNDVDGTWYIHVQAKDAAGNESNVVTVSAVLDNTAPTASISPAGSFFNIDQSITLSANEVADIFYTTDGSDPTTDSSKYMSAIAVTETTTIKFIAIDTAGNQTSVYTETYTIDIEAPALGSITISDNQGYTSQAKPTLQLASTGAAYMRFASSEEALSTALWLVFAETWNNFDISTGGEGTKTVWAEFKDLAGNIQTVHVSDSTLYDTTTPVSQVDKAGGIYEESVTIQLSTEEGSTIYYTVDGSTPTTGSTQYSNPISITEDTTIKFFAVDKAGNAEFGHTETYIIPVLSEIKINSDTILIDEYKGTVQFSATGVYENIDDKDITSQVEWISSNNETATIDETGLLTAIEAGFNSVEISAKMGQIVSNKIVVTLNILVTLESIEILPDYLVLTALGVTSDVIAIGHYSDETTENITMLAALIPGDNSIVSINTTGTVTAKGSGSTTLSAMKDGITSQIKVTVGDLDQTEIEEIIENRGNLILVTGGGTDDTLWPVSNALSDYVYKVFIGRGFVDDDIYFLNPETVHDYNSDGINDDIVDDFNPTLEAIQEAISIWAKQAVTEGPLYLILVDHGANQQFLVNTQGPTGIMTATQLNQWLNDFQTITGRQVVVIIEACQSGSFVGALKHTNRVIMASTETGQNSNLNNKFSFGKFFLSSIFKGGDLKNAYDIASNKLKYLPAPWKNQVPQFDDMQAGDLAQSIFVGGNFKIASASPVISGEVTASVASDGKVTISTTVTDLEGLQDVWAIVLPPDFTSQYKVDDFKTPDLTGLPTFDMTNEEGTNEYSVSTYSIAKAGDHKVIVYAMDTEGNIVNSEQKIVTITGVNPTCQISLAEGWNLICLCREPIDSSINVVLSDTKNNIASAWKWENNKWAVYLPGFTQEQVAAYIESKGFNQMTNITCGEGFWINSSINQSLSVSGAQLSDTGISLAKGWNLVGLKSGQGETVTTLISGNEGNIASLWKWKDGGWAVYLPGEDDGGAAYAQSKGFSVLTNIYPGEGFWVNATQQTALD